MDNASNNNTLLEALACALLHQFSDLDFDPVKRRIQFVPL